jgi:hypothetical protein
MQKIEEFTKYLKRKGKKQHVVDDLVRRCNIFEEFLRKRHEASIDDASKEDILAFLDALKNQKTDVNNYLRAVGLYFRFTSKPELSTLASGLREQRISSTRKTFELKRFSGVNEKYVRLLEKEGITTTDQMLERGRTSSDRKELSKKTGVPLESILEYVKLSDLSRLGAIKSIRARLYYDAGVDAQEKMASWNPEELRKMLVSYVKRTGFKGIAPLPKEVKNAVEAARRMERLVDYNE